MRYWREIKHGTRAEDLLIEQLKGKKSDTWQYDLTLELTVDVKALKKKKRSDEEVDDSIQWVEFKKNSGKPGWLYGPADLIIFETEDYWIVVNREVLREWAEGILLHAEDGRGFYEKYTRKGKDDLIMMVKTLDLCFLSDTMIVK